jgi:hypothetical protein
MPATISTTDPPLESSPDLDASASVIRRAGIDRTGSSPVGDADRFEFGDVFVAATDRGRSSRR